MGVVVSAWRMGKKDPTDEGAVKAKARRSPPLDANNRAFVGGLRVGFGSDV